jgi:hypothetical protein
MASADERIGSHPLAPSKVAERLRSNPVTSRLLRLLSSSWVLGVAIVLLSWQPILVTPEGGFDRSWNIALQMAAVEGLHWGTDIVFTYGPLGFLRAPLVANTWPAIVSATYLLAIRLALAASVIWIARRHLGLGIALLMAYVTVALTGADIASHGPAQAVPLVFIWCAVALEEPEPGLSRRLVLFGGGVLSAIEILGKLNEGLLIAGMCVVAATAMEGRRLRNVATFAATFLTCLVALWFATGQGISNVDDFVAGSFQVVRGYSSAMVWTPQATPQAASWTAPAALVTWALVLVASWLAGRALPVPRRLGLLLLAVGMGFIAWKEGFVRQDPFHMSLFFAWMLAPWIALRWRGGRLWAMAGFVAVAIVYFAATEIRPGHVFPPVENAKAAVSDLRTVFDPARRHAVAQRARLAMQSAYGVDPRTLSLLQDEGVDVWPWQTGIVWAYGLRWSPVPMFQTPTAYTSWLDQRNADALASSEGPERILRHATTGVPPGGAIYSIDARYAAYDAPAASLAMLCHFEALRTTPRYQVLGRVPDRCGAPRFLSSTDASYGQSVSVPRSPGRHEVVFARIDNASPSGIESLRALVYRAVPRYIAFDGRTTYRVVPDVLDDGLILDAPPRSDFPAPFSLAPNARTVTLLKDATALSPERELRYDFFAMRVRPQQRASHD